jgi:hypothetical protein
MEQQMTRGQQAASELAAHCLVYRPDEVVDRLQSGLSQIRDLLLARLHLDVERQFGVDSMIAPVSLSHELAQMQNAGIVIDAFDAVLAGDEIAARGYVDNPEGWLSDWLLALRFGNRGPEFRQTHVEPYLGLADSARRLRFVSTLQRVVPESIRTPPVLFLLYPYAVRIVAAMAFGDEARAQQLRASQSQTFAAIPDCHECRGRVLANEERCRCCGNPIWTFAWLRAT